MDWKNFVFYLRIISFWGIMLYMEKNKITAEKLNSRAPQLKNAIDDFFYSLKNPIFIAMVVLLSYLTGLTAVGLAVLVIFCCISLFLYDDLLPIIPTALSVSFIFCDLRFISFTNIAFILIIAPFAVSLIYHLIRFCPKKFIFGQLFVPIIAVTVALFAGGLFSHYLGDWLAGVPIAISIGPAVFALYVLFTNYVHPPKDVDVKAFFFWTLTSIGLLLSMQTLNYQLEGLNTYHLGWGNINFVGIILLICYPAPVFLMCRSKVILPYLLIMVFMLLGAFMTDGEGALGIMAIFTILLFLIAYKNMRVEKRKALLFWIGIAIIGVILLVIAVIALGYLPVIINKLIKTFTDDNMRTNLYKNAWRLFVQNPLFGAGVGYHNYVEQELSGGILETFNFHNTPLHVLSTMGLFGFIMYFCYFFVRYRILMENRSATNLIAWISFSMFELYGFLDPAEFVIMPNLIYIIVLMVIIEKLNAVHVEKLPLFTNGKNGVLLTEKHVSPDAPKWKKLWYSL